MYSEPNPSLCDSCIFAYFCEGGSASVGDKHYRQRYCPQPPPGKEGQPWGRAIHSGGYNECNYYKQKETVNASN